MTDQTEKEWGLVLAPGAGAGSDSPALVAVEAAVPPNFSVRRMDFPYRLAGKKAPDRPPVLLDAVRRAHMEMVAETGVPPERIFVGGRSMGGRIFSMAVAEGLPVAGLVLMSYPLHPPGKPEKLRVEHFPRIEVPVLLVSGTRDAFGSRSEFETHEPVIPGEVQHEWIEGGDHGMAKHHQEVAAVVTRWLEPRAS